VNHALKSRLLLSIPYSYVITFLPSLNPVLGKISYEDTSNYNSPVTMVDIVSKRAHYSPPWANVSIIGIAGSSGSGKSTLSQAIVSKLNLPWVVILSMVTTASYNTQTISAANTKCRTRFTRLWMKKDHEKRSETSTISITPMP
jgi:ABC-type dipeptide/oligopeptide/nickel transport system ATPase component